MSVKRYRVNGYEWELEEAGTRADVPVDEWPEVLVAATDFDALAKRLEEAERILRGLYEDNMDYMRVNKLGGENNHWLRQSRDFLKARP